MTFENSAFLFCKQLPYTRVIRLAKNIPNKNKIFRKKANNIFRVILREIADFVFNLQHLEFKSGILQHYHVSYPLKVKITQKNCDTHSMEKCCT